MQILRTEAQQLASDTTEEGGKCNMLPSSPQQRRRCSEEHHSAGRAVSPADLRQIAEGGPGDAAVSGARRGGNGGFPPSGKGGPYDGGSWLGETQNLPQQGWSAQGKGFMRKGPVGSLRWGAAAGGT